MNVNNIDSISSDELVKRAIRSLKPKRGLYLWCEVMKTFGLGSTFAQQLCRKHGFDPDAVIGKAELPKDQ